MAYPTERRLEVFEILNKIANAKEDKERVAILKQYSEVMYLRDVLQGTFDPAIQWNLPEGTPPYTPNEESSTPSSLARHHRKFKYFVKGLSDSERLNKIKRERMFIEILEAVHHQDASILVSMINKTSPVNVLTVKIVKEALPDLFRD